MNQHCRAALGIYGIFVVVQNINSHMHNTHLTLHYTFKLIKCIYVHNYVCIYDKYPQYLHNIIHRYIEYKIF